MKTFKLLLILLVSGSFILNACKDDEKDPEPGSGDKTSLLINSNWILTTATFNPAITVELGTFKDTFPNLFDIPFIDSCQKDNMILFNADGTMTIDNGKIKCAPSEPQTAKDGNWKFTDNDTKIQITNSEYFKLISSTAVILRNVSITNTELKGQTDYVFNDPLKGPVNTVISFTFTK